ncbi:hypothetical protein BCR35DRAFT_300360 [Leucosporidium creatinivorum]|uniref:Cep57 centrosome microtubule-binding domain-containing protein n=1 Tax=Leucosporidium creatinivorum TaxID=106004 RepID=A0A1Y2FYS4_9BASI|nr:hypothetical protein BCR35DRAFT_300360 [Leucosporidium creatinivorum]
MSAAVAHTPSQLRRTRQPLETPTPAPSSGHTSTLITSIKPTSRSQSFSQEYRKHPSYSLTSTQPRQPLGQASRLVNTIPECSTQELDLDDLEIPLDNTERDRRRLEHEFMDLAGGLPSDGGYSSESIGFGGLSDAEPQLQQPQSHAQSAAMRDLRARIEDESESEEEHRSNSARSRSSSSEQSFGDDFSLRVGMTGSRVNPMAPIEEVDNHAQQAADWTNDLSYVVSRTASPASPPPRQSAAAAPAPAPALAAAPSPASALSRGLGKEFERAQAQAQGAAQRQVFGDANGRPSPAVAAQQQQKAAPQPQPQAHRPSHAPRLVPYPRTSPSLAHGAKLASPPQPQPQPQPQAQRVRAPTPAARAPQPQPQTKKDYGTSAASAMPNVHYYGEEPSRRLPDMTGLTDGLQTPGLRRGGTDASESGADVDEFATLRARLAALERQNTLSRERVRELEDRLQEERAREGHQGLERGSEEWEERLRDEMARREDLEAQVHRLHSQIAHLTRSLESHSATLSALRSQPVAAQAQAQAQPIPDLALYNEVDALRTGLDALGQEMEVVKGAGEQWEREEEERREEMGSGSGLSAESEREPRVHGLARRDGERGRRSPAPAPETQQYELQQEDPDRTPGRGRRVGRISSSTEIQRLQAELAREEARRSPSPRPRRQQQQRDANPPRRSHHQHQHQHSAPTRPSTAPLPSHRQHYAPPLLQRRHPHYSAPETEREELAQDFRRAEEIFRSVKAPKKAAGVPGSPGLCSVCRRRKRESGGVPVSAPPKLGGRWEERESGAAGHEGDDEEERYEEEMRQRKSREKEKMRAQEKSRAPPKVDPQQALENVLRDLEDDFELHKRIYIELSDQYRSMDAKLGGGKRRALAEHLKESIDTLEIKADQVKRLHDLLHYHDPNAAPIDAGRPSFGAGRQRECVV